MGIKIGSQDITGIYVGSTPVQSVYVGSTLIWSNAPSAISFIFDSPLQAIKNQPGTQTVNGVTYALPEQISKNVTQLFEGQTKGLSNKLYLTKKNNTEKFTIIGNVTITDGIASGFSGSNKIKGPTLDFSNPFELIYSYTYNHDGRYQKIVLTGGFDVGPTADRAHWLWIRDEDGRMLLDAKCCNVTSGTKYVFKFTWDGSVYNHYVLSGGSWSLTNTFNSTKKLKSTDFYIGATSSGSEYIAGTVDLNEFSFTKSNGYSWTPYGSIVSFIATDSSLTPVGFDSYADTGYIVTLNNSLDTITNFA